MMNNNYNKHNNNHHNNDEKMHQVSNPIITDLRTKFDDDLFNSNQFKNVFNPNKEKNQIPNTKLMLLINSLINYKIIKSKNKIGLFCFFFFFSNFTITQTNGNN